MRECIYCGRSLEKGEQCTCAVSVAKRMAKEGNVPPKEEPKKFVRKSLAAFSGIYKITGGHRYEPRRNELGYDYYSYRS